MFDIFAIDRFSGGSHWEGATIGGLHREGTTIGGLHREGATIGGLRDRFQSTVAT